MTQDTKVLIVDDEAPIRTILTRWLNGWGVLAPNGDHHEHRLD